MIWLIFFSLIENIVALSKSDLSYRSKILKPVALKKGEHFINFNQSAKHLAFIESGLLGMVVIEEDDEKMLDFLLPESFAADYLCFLQDKLSESRITAIKDSSLLVINKTDLEALYALNENFQKLGRIIRRKLLH